VIVDIEQSDIDPTFTQTEGDDPTTVTVPENGVGTDVDGFKPADTKPVANDDTKKGQSGSPVTIEVLNNDDQGTNPIDPESVSLDPSSVPDGVGEDTDGDGDIDKVTVPNEGVWSVDPDTGAVTFTPKDGFIGDPTPIEYTIKDTKGNESNPAKIAVDYPPVAKDDSKTGESGESVTIDPLANDKQTSSPLDPSGVSLIKPNGATDVLTDGDGDIVGFTVPGEGDWRVDQDTGKVTFIPADGFTGNPTPIEYTVRDESGDESNRAKITILYPTPTATFNIGDEFFIDNNGNKIFDEGDDPIEGGIVELLDKDGNAMSCPYPDGGVVGGKIVSTEGRCIVKTNKKGKYGFKVDNGKYKVKFTLTKDLVDEGYVFGNVGENIEKVSNDTIIMSTNYISNANELDMDVDAKVSCGCSDIKSANVDSLNAYGILFMLLSLLTLNMFFVKKEDKI